MSSETGEGRSATSWAPRLHRLADRIDRRFGGRLRASKPLERAWIATLDAIVARQSDRRYMTRSILPAVRRDAPRRVLFVGVRGYTKDYGREFAGTPTEFWTSDIDTDAASYGEPSRHVTEDVRRIDDAFAPESFDVVLVNGVFGWGVDGPEDMSRALAAIARVLAPGGALLIGWNTDHGTDPDAVADRAGFAPVRYAGLPARKAFPDVTHVYAWYRLGA